MIKNVMRITINVTDQKEAREFWVDKLGFQVMAEIALEHGQWLEVAPHGSPTRFVLYETKARKAVKNDHPNVIFSCSHLGELRKKLIQCGVEMEEIITMPYGLMCVFYDPDHTPYMLREDLNG